MRIDCVNEGGPPQAPLLGVDFSKKLDKLLVELMAKERLSKTEKVRALDRMDIGGQVGQHHIAHALSI